MFKNSVILAGGHGSRMKPLTDYVPKALVEVDGLPLIYNPINLLKNYNINRYVTYNYKSNQLFKRIESDVNGFINTKSQDNSYFIFNSFIHYIDEGVLILPCDIKIEIDLKKLYDDYIEQGSPAIMVVGVKPNSEIDGDFIFTSENNKIKYLNRTEKTNLYCSGLQIINPNLIYKLIKHENNFYKVWEKFFDTDNLKLSNIQPDSWYSYDNIKQIK
jgi:MurNAc alpha-1-phosphate uridylyltransferase